MRALLLVVVTLGIGCHAEEPPLARPESAAAAQRLPPDSAPSSEAIALAREVVVNRIRAHAEEFDATGHWRGDSPFSDSTARALDVIFQRQDPAADEAIALLERVYLGEETGETMTCETTARGPRMVGPLTRFAAFDPRRWFPELPARLVLEGESVRIPELIAGARKSDVCEFD